MRASQAVVGAMLLVAAGVVAQTAPPTGAATPPFVAGAPLGITADGRHTPPSANVRVLGSIVNAESCSYDPSRDLIAVVNRGANQNEVPNDGFVSLLRHDGSIHTPRWIGADRNGLTLNHPFGSEVRGGKLYLSDSDGGTADGAPRTAVIRVFDLATGRPERALPVAGSPWLNDIAVAADGTIYGTQTGSADGSVAMRLYRIAPDGATTMLIEGEPLARPNGVAIDGDGNVVVVNMNDARVVTLSPAGRLLKTEQSAQPGSDGIVIMPDGTKFVSSVLHGGVSRIRPGRAGELIATGIPAAASMCLDPKRRQLVIPMNANNALAFVQLP